MEKYMMFRCPSCGLKIAISEENYDPDEFIKCPRCGKLIKIGTLQSVDKKTPSSPGVARELRMKKPQIASILLIISALLGFAFTFNVYTENLPQERSAVVSGQGSIFGTVLDENGTGLEGVKVYLPDVPGIKAVYTDSRGFFIIHNIPSGKHTLRLEYTGYRTQILYVDVEVGKTTIVEITMTRGSGEDINSGFTSHIEREEYIDRRDINAYFTYILLGSSILALLGGITARMERFYRFTLLGSIGGLVAVGFFVGSALAVIAMALIILAKEEFE